MHLKEPVFNPYAIFSNWVENITFQQPFFTRFEKILRICYSYIYDEITREIKKKTREDWENEHFLIKNFTNFLEIFLNEFRKSLIATGDYDFSNDDKSQTVYINFNLNIKEIIIINFLILMI